MADIAESYSNCLRSMDKCIEDRAKILQAFDNEYAASMYVAAKAKQILLLSNNALTESEAIHWVISRKPLSELSSYIKKKKAVIREQKYSLINEYASNLYDKSLEAAFRRSAIESNKQHKLIIYYEQLDYTQCVRLRIILKQYWLDHITYESENRIINKQS